MTAPRPYLSVVVAGRNDDHGGNPLYRLQLFIDSLVEQCDRLDLPAELVIVEWNPPANRPRLAEVLDWPPMPGRCSIRIIEVPEELHMRLDHAASLPLFQMIAKNVGIRRAQGEFVLATNIDLLFDDVLMRRIARRGLRKNRLYRADRYDVPARLDATFAARMRWARRSVIRIHTARGSVDLRTREFFPIGMEPALTRLVRRALVRRPHAFLRVRRVQAVLEELWVPLARAMAGASPTNRIATVAAGAAEVILATIDAMAAGIRSGMRLLHDVVWLIRVFTYWFWCGIREPRLAPRRAGRRLHRVARGTVARLRSFRVGSTAAVSVAKPGSLRKRRGTIQLWRSKRALTPLHTNACGDFTLMSREDWEATRGYPELQQFSMHIDGLFLYQAHYAGVRQHVLPYPVFHIEHGAGFRPDSSSVRELEQRLERARIPQISSDQFEAWVLEMRARRGPLPFNDGGWGLADEDLTETVPTGRALQVVG